MRQLTKAAALALALTTGVATAAPAQAADSPGLLGNLTKVAQVAGIIKSGIEEFAQFSGAVKPPLPLIQQIQALLLAEQKDIAADVNAVAAGQLLGGCDTAASDYQTFTARTDPADRDLFLDKVNDCVNTAAELILQSTPDTSPKTIDVFSTALNIAAVESLTAAAFYGKPANVELQNIISGDEAVLTKMAPTCGSTPNDSFAVIEKKFEDAGSIIPGNDGSISLLGHDTCYNYTRTGPTPGDKGSIGIFPTGAGTGVAPWTVTGDGEPNISGGVFTSGHHINWPAQSDFSIPQDQAMAATSWPIAKQALADLLPDAAPFQSTVAMTTAPGGTSGTPTVAFQVDPAGVLERSTVILRDRLGDVTFSGWTKDTTPNAPTLKSVAAVANSDGRYQVFGLDRAGRLFTQWEQKPRDNTSWTAWDLITGPPADAFGGLSSVTVARNANGSLQIFANDVHGTDFSRTMIPNGDYADKYKPGYPTIVPATNNWTPWQQFGTGATVSLSATNMGGLIDLYGVNAGGQLWRRQESQLSASDITVPGNWTDWEQLATPGNGGVALKTVSVTTADTGQWVLATDGANRLWATLFSGPWTQIPGNAHFAAAGVNGDLSYLYALTQDPAGNTVLSDQDAFPGDPWQAGFCVLNAPRTCDPHQAPVATYQTGANTLSTLTGQDSKTHDTGVKMMPGTSPSVTPSFPFATAFVGADGFLYNQLKGSAPTKLAGGIPVASGTSPSVTAGGGGFWEIAYVKPNHQIAMINSAGQQFDLNGFAEPGTSPSIMSVRLKQENDPGGGTWVAFQHNTDHLLFTVNPASQVAMVGSGLVMAPGTSPDITTNGQSDNWEIAIDGPGGALATVDNSGAVHTGIAAIGGSSTPSIVFVPDLGFVAAFRGSDGTVWTSGPGGTKSLGSGAPFTVAAGTTPAIGAANIDDYEVAYHGVNNNLETLTSQGAYFTLGPNTIAAGTSPAIIVPTS